MGSDREISERALAVFGFCQGGFESFSFSALAAIFQAEANDLRLYLEESQPEAELARAMEVQSSE